MKNAYDLLLLMFSISNLHNPHKVIELFIDGMHQIFHPLTFKFNEKPKQEGECEIIIQARGHIFGSVEFDPKEEVAVRNGKTIRNSVQMLGVILQRIALESILNKEKDSYKKIADDRYQELLNTVNELERSKSEAEQLANDLNQEIKRKEKYHKALKESELRWHFAVEGNGDGLWDIDLSKNSVYYSDQWKRMLGFDADEIDNTLSEWEKLIHPDDRESALKIANEYMSGITEVYSNQHRMLCKGGSYKWVLSRGKVISYDKQNKPLRVIGTHTDLTNRIKSEELLRENERKLSTLISNLPGMVFRSPDDQERIFDFASNQSELITGYTPEELAGEKLSYSEIIDKDDRKIVNEQIRKAITEDRKYVIEYRIRKKSGETRWIWEQGLGIKESNKIKHLEGFIMDITDRKKDEIELRTLKFELESQVNDKTMELKARISELERFHNATIEREFRIKELRNEITTLKASQ